MKTKMTYLLSVLFAVMVLSILCGCTAMREIFIDRLQPCPFAADDLQQRQGITSFIHKAEVYIYPFHSDSVVKKSIRKGLYAVRLRKPLEEVSRIKASLDGFRLVFINGHYSITMDQAMSIPFGNPIYAEVFPGYYELGFMPLSKLMFTRQETENLFLVNFIAEPGAWYKFEKELIDHQAVRKSDRERLVQEKYRIYCVSLIDGRLERELLKFREVSGGTYLAFYPVERQAQVENNHFKAEQGNALAQYQLCVSYAYGEGMKQDMTEAAKWCRKAADQGFPSAMRNLGVLYMYGEGVEKNVNEAIKWWRKGDEIGDKEAQFFLGNAYAMQEDMERAVKYWKKSAEQGYSDAQYILGLHYESIGGSENIEKAEAWYSRAAKQGHADAKARLKDLQ